MIANIASQARNALSHAFKCDVILKLNLKDRDEKSHKRRG